MTSPSDHSGTDLLEIDPVFAQALGLEPKKSVSIKVHNASSQDAESAVPLAHTVYLEPQTSSDWEIIELHAQYLEARMLNQVRAISAKQPVVVFPSSTSIATLSVLKIEPPVPPNFDFAKLSVESEVVIAPKVRKKTPTTKASTKQNEKSTNNRSVAASSTRRRREAAGPCVLLRGLALPHSTVFSSEVNQTSDYQIFVTPDAVLPLGSPTHAFVSIVRPKSISRSSNGANGPGGSGAAVTPASANPGSGGSADAGASGSNTNSGPDGADGDGNPADDDSGEVVYPARKIVAKISHSQDGPQDHVGLSHALAIALGVSESIGNVVRIEAALKPLANPPSAIIVRPYVTSSSPSASSSKTGSALKMGKRMDALSQTEKLAKQLEEEKQLRDESIRTFLADSQILQGPITNNMRLPPIADVLPYGGVLQLKSAEGWINPNKSTQFTVDIGTNLIQAESNVGRPLAVLLSASSKKDESRPRVVGIDKTLVEINDAVRSGFSVGGLIYGSRGSGKTAVLQDIARELSRDCIYSVFLSCAPKSEDPVGSIKELLSRVLLEASWYAPSVVILDDLDKLVPAEVEHADSTKTRQLAEIFQQIAQTTMAARPVCILASSQSKESIHAHLVTSHVFEESFHLKSPDKEVRRAIIKEAIRSLGMETDESFDMLEIAGSTEGYQPGDLWTLVERSKHQTIIRRVETLSLSSNSIIQDDFTKALAGFIPASLRGVKLQKSNVSWKEIGGLRETKRILLETLEWPTRYAPIFAKSPLRLRSGLLLYGYPGCGKTLLASAVASESGLNFISIKGPEILNKYIGASEQSVRDLFERAQAAKPCILFFDEFDSIAPKRGHDSTGVTDRVVNQMLTQMDGAEGLDGVYVLAATSRPDLIDSALLRPGRLDKSMICDMPDFEDRLDILNAVANGGGKMDMSDSVDLKDVAARTEGYSGADLQAVLYNAYLEAVHDLVDVPEEVQEESEDKDEEEDDVEFFQSEAVNGDGAALPSSVIAKARARVAQKAKLKKQLEAFSDNSNASKPAASADKAGGAGKAKAVIEPHHITKSLEETQPSISQNERLKLKRIYDQFVSGRSGDMPNGENSTEIGGRATLM